MKQAGSRTRSFWHMAVCRILKVRNDMGSHGRIQTFSNRDQVIDLFRGAELLINAGKKTVGSTDIGSGGNGKGKDRFGIFDMASLV